MLQNITTKIETFQRIQKEKISKSLLKRANLLRQEKDIPFRTCIICGKTFEPNRLANGRLSKSNTCSKECHTILLKENGKETYAKLVSEGNTHTWTSRNITSYPERFWEQVLDNNHIQYKREDFSTKKYFLDFLIEKNDVKIDLEIDGKQHNYPIRKENDALRDAFLSERGFVVYRIKWNTINTEKGKALMKEKIDAFFKFYNSI